MNINTRNRRILFLLFLFGLLILLIREYSYVHPYNPGWRLIGPRWTYTSTRTFTWWFLLITSLIASTPLVRKQLIGIFGLTLFLAVLMRPVYQNEFPEETASEFFEERKGELKSIVNQTEIKNQIVINQRINKIGFEKLIVKDSIFYFFFFNEEIPFGISYTQRKILPKDTSTFGRNLKFKEIEKYWYELDE